MDFSVLEPPREPWVDRLRRNHRVWLVKEQIQAIVAWAWEPPEPGMNSGRIAIQKLINNYVQRVEVWYVDVLGRGINKSQLFAPLEGHLPDEPEPISEPIVRQLQRDNAAMKHRLEVLETRVHRLMVASGMVHREEEEW
jgi:hypothetical protein